MQLDLAMATYVLSHLKYLLYMGDKYMALLLDPAVSRKAPQLNSIELNAALTGSYGRGGGGSGKAYFLTPTVRIYCPCKNSRN